MSADAARTTVLITGFGPFPGVPVNATMRLVPTLGRLASAAFPGVRFVTEILATEWAAGPRRLAVLLEETRPDLVLHFGVSSRARGFEIESRARNACCLTPDAAGAVAPARHIDAEGAMHLPASLPVHPIVSRLRRHSIPAYTSRDAGAYLCNATLYHSIAHARRAPGRRVGFIHIPASLARPGAANRGRSGACPLTWPQAIAGALHILSVSLARDARLLSAQHFLSTAASSRM